MANKTFGNVFRAAALSLAAVTAVSGGMAVAYAPPAHAEDAVVTAQKKLNAIRAHTAAMKKEIAANEQEIASIDRENGCRDAVASAKKDNQIDMNVAYDILGGVKPSAYGWCKFGEALKARGVVLKGVALN